MNRWWAKFHCDSHNSGKDRNYLRFVHSHSCPIEITQRLAEWFGCPKQRNYFKSGISDITILPEISIYASLALVSSTIVMVDHPLSPIFFTLSVSISWNGATINLQCDKQCDFHFMLCHFVFGRRAEIVSLFPHFLLLFFTLYRKIHNNDHAYIYRIGMVLNHSHCSLYQATMNFCWCGFAAHDLLQSNNTHVMNDCTFQYFCGKCFQKVCFRQNGWDAFIKSHCGVRCGKCIVMEMDETSGFGRDI